MKDSNLNLEISTIKNFVVPPINQLFKTKIRLFSNGFDIPTGTVLELHHTELFIPNDINVFSFLISKNTEGKFLSQMITEANKAIFFNPLETILTTPIKIWVYSNQSINDYVSYI